MLWSFLTIKFKRRPDCRQGSPTRMILWLPSRRLPCGTLVAFKSYSNNIALFASLGAFANAAPDLHRLCSGGLPPRFSRSIIRTLTLVREKIDDETAARCLPVSSSSANECLHFFAETEQGKQAAVKLQKTLSAAAAQKITAALLDVASPTSAARFFACSLCKCLALRSLPRSTNARRGTRRCL